MKIIWSDFAINTLKEIYDYYKENATISVAKKIKSNIFTSTKPLLKNPDSGQIELNLESLNEEHRYLVESNYKIVYKQVTEGILITDVFDCRQDPIKINDENRKPSR
ncbi:MAG: type II toxin-antitoxin system RelE/ParE family toxin [Salinivirgaceae bacterium]|nr:type II toxin-antitoxin system RelE/ParE family toxin [Salinivirgaceae bacterium]